MADILPRPSTIWMQKAITLFSRFDKDGDGYLSEKDILIYVDAFKKYGCLSNERTARMRDKTFSFWTLLNKGAKKVTLEDFVKVGSQMMLQFSRFFYWRGKWGKDFLFMI